MSDQRPHPLTQVTCVESLLLTGIITIIATLVSGYTQISELKMIQLEALLKTQELAEGAKTFYYAIGEDESAEHTTPRHFPSSIGPTPSWFACSAGERAPHRAEHYQDISAFGHTSWVALNFTVDPEFHYRYAFDSRGTEGNATFNITADADLDCDGITSRVELLGHVDAEGVVRTSLPAIYEGFE